MKEFSARPASFGIPNPCHESWDAMTAQENGRYCGSCRKVVIDFTQMTEQQIIDHLAANTGKKMCGTFRRSQLQPPPEKHRNNKVIRFLAAVLLVFGMSLFSCQTDEPVKKPDPEPSISLGEPELQMPEKTDSVPYPEVIMEKHRKEGPKIPVIVCGGIESEDLTGIIIPDSTVPELQPEAPILGMIYEPMPEYQGGEAKLREYIASSIQYPDSAKNSGISGTVYIRFTVCGDGTVNNARVLRGIGYGCDEAALKVIREMPGWKPGTVHGAPADVEMILPVKFNLK
ncbi:MAG: energy transducer TonB [Bacteroidetes bacterium]|nr:energy transducer TonB [Bacteroidota bacterium]